MTHPAPTRRRGSYGIDAPVAFTFIAVMTIVCVSVAIIAASKGIYGPLISAAILLFISTFVFQTTLRGKFIVWSRLLDSLNLRGDERILDLGCGRGAVLLMAAKRLTSGSATGRRFLNFNPRSSASICGQNSPDRRASAARNQLSFAFAQSAWS